MSGGKDVSHNAGSELRQYTCMTYAEDQACNLPKVERASVNNKAIGTPPNNERIVHG